MCVGQFGAEQHKRYESRALRKRLAEIFAVVPRGPLCVESSLVAAEETLYDAGRDVWVGVVCVARQRLVAMVADGGQLGYAR